jgi:hypothetical protein
VRTVNQAYTRSALNSVLSPVNPAQSAAAYLLTKTSPIDKMEKITTVGAVRMLNRGLNGVNRNGKLQQQLAMRRPASTSVGYRA